MNPEGGLLDNLQSPPPVRFQTEPKDSVSPKSTERPEYFLITGASEEATGLLLAEAVAIVLLLTRERTRTVINEFSHRCTG